MGTVHKAKGLEFDTVHVLDDFVKVPCARHNLAQLPHFRVGEHTESSLWGCLAFSRMVWPLGRILLEQKGPPGPQFIILRLWFLEKLSFQGLLPSGFSRGRWAYRILVFPHQTEALNHRLPTYQGVLPVIFFFFIKEA